MSNTHVFANFDQTSEEKCMFFSFLGNYFFIVRENWLYQLNNQEEEKKKEKERKADKLRANDLPVRKNTYPVYYLKGYTG